MINEKQLENKEKVKMSWQVKIRLAIEFIFLIVTLLVLFDFLNDKVFDTGNYLIIITDKIGEIFNLSVNGLINLIFSFSFVLTMIFPVFVLMLENKDCYDFSNCIDSNEKIEFIFNSFLFLIINISIIFGILKSKKIVIYFAIFRSITTTAIFIYLLFAKISLYYLLILLIPLLISLIILYLDFVCLKHPYFNQNKIK